MIPLNYLINIIECYNLFGLQIIFHLKFWNFCFVKKQGFYLFGAVPLSQLSSASWIETNWGTKGNKKIPTNTCNKKSEIMVMYFLCFVIIYVQYLKFLYVMLEILLSLPLYWAIHHLEWQYCSSIFYQPLFCTRCCW